MIYENVDAFLEACGDLVEHPRHRSIVATSGVFDIIHIGHVKLLRYAALLGSIVVVLLNKDQSVRAFKSIYRPIMPWPARAQVLDSLQHVDYVIGFDEQTPVTAIRKIAPNLWIKGNRDLEELPEKDDVFDMGCDIIVLWNCVHASTTNIIERAHFAYVSEYGEDDENRPEVDTDPAG